MAIPGLPDGGGCGRDADQQAGGGEGDGQGGGRADELTVGLARELRAGRDLDTAGLEALEHGVVAGAAPQDPPGHPGPAERPGGREDPHVEQAVVGPGPRKQDEAAGQQADVPHHHGPGVGGPGRAAGGADLEVGARPGEPPHTGHGVSQPADGSLNPGRGRAHHGGVQSDAGHRGEGDAVGDGQVDPPLVLAEADRERGAERGRYAQRRSHQVGRAARHDGQRDRAAGQGLSAGLDRAVAAHREHQLRAGRDRLPRHAVARVGRPRLQQLDLPAVASRGRRAPAGQPREAADPVPVHDEHGGRHHGTGSGTAARQRATAT
jgi:hypothetical protein